MESGFFEAAVSALEQNGEFSNKTSGKSMYPMLRSGKDIIVIKPARFPLKKHDVILYRKAGITQLVLHRVIKPLSDNNYLVRGDNTYYTETVNAHDVAGVLSGFFRNGKYHDCATDKLYRVYIPLMRAFYPVRYAFVYFIRPTVLRIINRLRIILK